MTTSLLLLQKVDREALAALLAFHDAASLEAASVPLVRRIAAVLERSRRGISCLRPI